MQTVRLGGTGLRVSRLCLGMMSYGDPAWRPWILDEAATRVHVRAAAEAGITFFDTADVYSATSARRTCGRGNSPRRNTSRSSTAGHRS